MPDQLQRRIVVGTMTGTSIDGLDVAVMALQGHGLSIRGSLLAHTQFSLGSLADGLRAVAHEKPHTARELATLAHAFGELHAEAILHTLDSLGQAADLVALHGQTIFHAPPLSWALLDPVPLIGKLPCPIVFNLRQRDLGLGGQGAPITPLADWILFRDERPRQIVNLGGFCNQTSLPALADGPDGITGCDVCPCNLLLDEAARSYLNQPFDRDGQNALQGTPEEALARKITKALVVARSPDAPHALGTGEEMTTLLDELTPLKSPQDRLATLLMGITHAISESLDSEGEVLFFGGGCHNKALRAALTQALGHTRVSFGHHQIEPEVREAASIAILGALAADGVSVTLPAVTGRAPSGAHRDGTWFLASSGVFIDPEHSSHTDA